MAKSDDDGFLKARMDPAVAAILNDSTRRQNDRSLPKSDRAKVIKARDKQTARNGKRAVYDLPEDLIDQYKQLAEKHGTTASQVVMIALRYFAQSGIDLNQFKKTMGKNPRYECRMVWFDSTSYVFDEK